MKENKKKLILLSTFLLLFVLLGVGTIAYFRRTVNGVITGQAGNLVLIVNEADAVKNETFSIVLKNSENGDYIHPDDKGSFDINIDSTGSSGDVSVTITLSRTNLPENLKFYLDEEYKNELTTKTYIIKKAASMTKTVPVYWYWDGSVDDENDILFINQELTADVSVTAAIGVIDTSTYVMTGLDGQYQYIMVGDNKIQLVRYLGSETDVVIPAEYDGYGVYSVGNIDATSAKATRYNIFGATNTVGNSTVKSVTIEEGVEAIELGAFDRCTALTTISLPDSITLIDDYAFYQCTNLAGTLDLPENLVELGRLAFSGDPKLTGELVIPNTVTTMEAGVFQQCSGLTSVTFEENSTLTSIPEYTFYGCTNLAGEINLPNTITSIGQSAFYELKKLTGDLTIPDSVTSIGKAAFQGCGGFNGVLTLSSALEEIGDYAFNHCSGFTNTILDIPESVQLIGTSATEATHVFYDFATKTIEEYTVNDSNNGIGTNFKVVDGVLYTADQTRLVAYPASKVGNSYIMPEGVTILDELAFSRAGSSYSGVPDTGLKTLTLPNSYVISTTLPSVYLNVGNTLTTALYIYTGVNEVLVKDDNPNYMSSDGILYSKDGTELWYIPHAKTGNIVIPDTVTTIRSGSLSLGRLAATSLYIPASVTNIEATAILEINQIAIDKKTTVTFDPNCVYQFNASGKVVKSS